MYIWTEHMAPAPATAPAPAAADSRSRQLAIYALVSGHGLINHTIRSALPSLIPLIPNYSEAQQALLLSAFFPGERLPLHPCVFLPDAVIAPTDRPPGFIHCTIENIGALQATS